MKSRFIVVAGITALLAVSRSSARAIQLPDTGQSNCYITSGAEVICVGSGQDGELRPGEAWPDPRFTDHGDGTVTDNLTGLMWTKSAKVQTGTTWQGAFNYTAGMNEGSNPGYGQASWRLPNKRELGSLIDYGRSNPSLSIGHPFTDVQNGCYWSSTTYAGGTSYAWTVSPWSASLSFSTKTSATCYTWAVRDGFGSGVGTHQVSGEVHAANTGARLAGITVTLNTGESAITDSSGNYVLYSLSSGWHTIQVKIAGYLPFSRAMYLTTDSTINLALDSFPEPAIQRTGQSKCYDTSGTEVVCAGRGQDGELRPGVGWPDPRFTDHGNGTVIDNLTGLMWTKSAKVQTGTTTWQGAFNYTAGMNEGSNPGYGQGSWRLPNKRELGSLIDYGRSNPSLSIGHPFTDVQNGCYWSSTTYAGGTSYAWTVSPWSASSSYSVKTSATCYTWAVRDGSGSGVGTHQVSGEVHAANMGASLAGITVRLNTGESAITDASGNYVFYSLSSGWHTLQVTAAGYLLFSRAMYLTTDATVNLALASPPVPAIQRTGQSKCSDASGTEVACAGSGQDGELRPGVGWPDPRFTDHGDGTVTDNLTGLMWTKSARVQTGTTTWQGAFNYTAGMNEGSNPGYGQATWRLPNKRELGSLIDYGRSNPSLSIGHPFTDVQNGCYWSSTTYAGGTSYAWTVSPWSASSSYTGKTSATCYTWAVRGGSDNPRSLSVSGTVKNGGATLENVLLALVGENVAKNETTNAAGYYRFSGLTAGTFSLTPTKAGYTFSPASRNLGRIGSAVSGQDFAACLSSMTISGRVTDSFRKTALAGVTVLLGADVSTVTDANGNYQFAALGAGAYSIRVSHAGYTSRSLAVTLTCSNRVTNIPLTAVSTLFGGATGSGYSKDPVNTATGNYIYQKADLSFTGRGLSFGFERNYNSQEGAPGPLGYGWNHSYNIRLSLLADGGVVVRWGDGKTETWTPDGAGGFTTQVGVFDTLVDTGAGTYKLTKKDGTVYSFDDAGFLTRIADRNTNEMALTWSGGLLSSVVDPVGRTVTFTHDLDGRIVLLTDPIGREVSFEYDLNGDLATATDPNGNVTTYTYDAEHQITAVMDPRGNTVVANVYDALKRVVTSQQDAKGGQTTYVYDEVAQRTSLQDPLGNITYHYHDDLLRLVREQDELGNSAYYTYDSAGNRTDVKDRNGAVTTYTYDATGNVLTKTDPLGGVASLTYDGDGNPLTKTDEIGNVTTFEYDASGNVTKAIDPLGNAATTTYNPHGQPLVVTDPAGGATTYTYGADGTLTGVADALGNMTGFSYDGIGRRITQTAPLGRTTQFVYDTNGNLLRVTDPLGNVTISAYDGNSNKISVTDPRGNVISSEYDEKDLPTRVTDALGHASSTAFDALDRKTATTDARGNVTHYFYSPSGNLTRVEDAAGNSERYTYDAAGNRLSTIDRNGKVTLTQYDTMGRVVRVTDPLGNATAREYDALGRTTRVTDPKGRATTFAYDARGKLLQVTDAAGGAMVYTYDSRGNRTSVTDPKGNASLYEFDAVNRVTRVTDSLGGFGSVTYDAAGDMNTATDPNGDTVTYAYDANTRLTLVTYPGGSTVLHTYDANGNRIGMVDGVGASTNAFDALNRLIAATDGYGKTLGYEYDAAGNRSAVIYPDGKRVEYSHDVLNRLATVTDWLGGVTRYAYDATGNLVSETRPNGTAVSYGFDRADRVTSLVNAAPGGATISSHQQTFNAVGNITRVVKVSPVATMPEAAGAYVHDADNRLVTTAARIYAHDDNGNMTRIGDDAFAYDKANRLVQSTVAGTASTYIYDGLGNRVSRAADGITTRYVVDTGGVLSRCLAETDQTGVINRYHVYGLGLISSVSPLGDARYYHYDPRGSSEALTDGVGAVTDTYAYTTFGSVSTATGSTANPFRFLGRHGVMDDGSGINYVRARYYAPTIGRFLTKDPRGYEEANGQTVNKYLYALNNPIRLVDISGLSPQEALMCKSPVSGSSDTSNNQYIDYKGLMWSLEKRAFKYSLRKAGGILASRTTISPILIGKTTGFVNAQIDNFLIMDKLAKNIGKEFSEITYDSLTTGDFSLLNRWDVVNSVGDGVASVGAIAINTIVSSKSLGLINLNMTGKDLTRYSEKYVEYAPKVLDSITSIYTHNALTNWFSDQLAPLYSR